MSNASILPGAVALARLPALSKRRVKARLVWFDCYRTHQQNAALTCRHFGISWKTFYH